MDNEELEAFLSEETTTCECLQVAPMGNGRAAILYLLSDVDFVTTLSVIYVVDDFEPLRAVQVLFTSEWLMSLSASPTGELFALEATTWIWRYAGQNWARDRVSQQSMRRVWAKGPESVVVGSDGLAYRLTGQIWQPIPPIAQIQYYDVHGYSANAVYACGDQGALHRLGQSGWQPVETYQGERFRGLDVAADGTIRLAGDDGLCLRIAGDEAVKLEGTELTCFAVRTFKGNAYWGDEAGLYIERGDVIEPFEGTDIASDLRTDTDFLYVAGTDTAWRFDGANWKTLTLIYESGFRLV
jgi:hypothetical protein